MKANFYYYECLVIFKETHCFWSLVSDIDISCETASKWVADAIAERTGSEVKVFRVWRTTRKACLQYLMIINYTNFFK